MECQDEAKEIEASVKTIPLHRLSISVILIIANVFQETNHFENRDEKDEYDVYDWKWLLDFVIRKFDSQMKKELEKEDLSDDKKRLIKEKNEKTVTDLLTVNKTRQKTKFILKFWSSHFREDTLQDLFNLFDSMNRYDLISDISEEVLKEIYAVKKEKEFDFIVVNGTTFEDTQFAEWLVNHLENEFFSRRIYWPTRDGAIQGTTSLGAISNVVEIGVLAIYSANDNIEDPAHYGNIISPFTSEENLEARDRRLFPIWHGRRMMKMGNNPLQPIFDKPGEFWPKLKVCGVIDDDFPPDEEYQNFPGTNENSIETASAHYHVAQEGNEHAIQVENGHSVEYENGENQNTPGTNENSIITASAHVAQEGNGHAIRIENGHSVEHENRWTRLSSWIINKFDRRLPEPHNSPLLSRASSQHDSGV